MNQNLNRINGLYAVTPDTINHSDLTQKVEAALLGGARIVQYRNKTLATSSSSADIRKHLEMASALAKLCRQHKALFIVNDDADLALDVGADGVHLGGEDSDIAAARKLLGMHSIIGASCYNSLERAIQAEHQGADYVAFGAVFLSSTKPNARHATLTLLRDAKAQLNLPIVAIGGITLHNAKEVIAAGADAIAVISALFTTPDIQQTARQFSDLYR